MLYGKLSCSRVASVRRMNMIRTKKPNWRELSEAASQEQDSEKLMNLVHELNEVLRRQEEALIELRRSA
jgi:hypothetical protein